MTKIILRRTDVGAITANMQSLQKLKMIADMEKPYLGIPYKDWSISNWELWEVEEQFYLKYRQLFQDIGFYPLKDVNYISN